MAQRPLIDFIRRPDSMDHNAVSQLKEKKSDIASSQCH